MFKFKNNIIFLDYNFRPDTSCYSFKKYAGKTKKFRDASLPRDKQLEKTLGQNCDSLLITPEKFMENKALRVLCNDQPPSLYMAVYLWAKVLHYYLDAEQLLEYRRGNPRKIQDLTISIDNLVADLNKKYIPNGNIRRSWIKETISFLENANLASFESDNQITIHYHNFQKSSILKRFYGRKGASEHAEILDLGNLIAQQFCNNINKRKDEKQINKGPSRKIKQKSLFDF